MKQAKMLGILQYCGMLSLLPSIIILKDPSKKFGFNFFQSDYKVQFERLEMVRFNSVYVKNYSVITFKYNRTCAAVNTTLILNKDLENDVEVVVQAYKFLSNEYRFFPMRFQFNYCVELHNDIIGLASRNPCVKTRECPYKKNTVYQKCNLSPDPSKMPPFLPDGKYMLELQALYFSEEVYLNRAYFSVSRPIFAALRADDTTIVT